MERSTIPTQNKGLYRPLLGKKRWDVGCGSIICVYKSEWRGTHSAFIIKTNKQQKNKQDKLDDNDHKQTFLNLIACTANHFPHIVHGNQQVTPWYCTALWPSFKAWLTWKCVTFSIYVVCSWEFYTISLRAGVHILTTTSLTLHSMGFRWFKSSNLYILLCYSRHLLYISVCGGKLIPRS